MKEPNLKGEKVILRFPLDEIKAELITDYFQDEDQVRHMTAVPYPYTNQDAKNFIKFLETTKEVESTFEWGIFDKETDQFIGMVGLEEIDYDIGKGELGYWLAKDYWGKGYTKEATTMVLDFAFNELELERVEAYVVKENEPSLRLLESLAFQVEGLMRRAALNKGELVDRYVCGILKEEWQRS